MLWCQKLPKSASDDCVSDGPTPTAELRWHIRERVGFTIIANFNQLDVMDLDMPVFNLYKDSATPFQTPRSIATFILEAESVLTANLPVFHLSLFKQHVFLHLPNSVPSLPHSPQRSLPLTPLPHPPLQPLPRNQPHPHPRPLLSPRPSPRRSPQLPRHPRPCRLAPLPHAHHSRPRSLCGRRR